MNKFLSLFCGLSLLFLFAKAQKQFAPDYFDDGPPFIWEYEVGYQCNVQFLVPKCSLPPPELKEGEVYECSAVSGNREPGYNETLTAATRSEAHRPSFIPEVKDQILGIKYEGFCPCWIVVFSGKNSTGSNLAVFATESGLSSDAYSTQDSGVIQLASYLNYNQASGTWEPWSEIVSSYSIYCHWGYPAGSP
jgi:hypothetical protein